MDPNLFKKIFIFVLVSYWYTCLYLLVPEGHIFCGLCLQSLPNWFSAPVANNDQEPELFITSLVCTYVPNYGYGEIWDFKNKELGGIPEDFIRTLSLSTSSFDVSFSSELWPKKKKPSTEMKSFSFHCLHSCAERNCLKKCHQIIILVSDKSCRPLSEESVLSARCCSSSFLCIYIYKPLQKPWTWICSARNQKSIDCDSTCQDIKGFSECFVCV